MADNLKMVQANTLYLAGNGVLVGATSAVLSTLTDIYGNVLTMTDFGTKGYITFEPDTTNEESATFTGITPNANGTYTLTGLKTSLAKDPYTETSGLIRQHAGGTKLVITDTAAFWATFNNKNDDETINGVYTFTQSPTVPDPTTQTQVANKEYVDGVAIAGAAKATETVYGIAKLSTPAVSSLIPIVVGDNDTRVPTQGENDALVGTSGTPGSSNKYVTNDDTSTSGTPGKVIRLNGSAYPAADGSAITGISLKKESYTASGNINQNDSVYITSANTVKSIYPSAMGTGSSISTPTISVTAPKDMPLSTNGYFLHISGGTTATSTPLKAQVRYINAGETDLSNGTEVPIYSTGNGVRGYDVCSIGTDKFLFIFQTDTAGSPSGIKTVVATVSGTTITVGLVQGIETTGNFSWLPSCSKVDTDKGIIFYQKDSDQDIYAQVLTVSGTTISINTPVSVKANGGGGTNIVSAQYSTNNVVVAYSESGITIIYGRTISVSGTVPTINAEQTLVSIGSAGLYTMGIRAISATKFLFAYWENNVPTNTKILNIALSGSTLTPSSTINGTTARSATYFGMHVISSNYALFLEYASSNSMTLFFLDVSGTAPVQISTQNLSYISITLFHANSIVPISSWTYCVTSSSNDSDYIVKLTPSSTLNIGLAESSISDTTTGNILSRYNTQTLSGITLIPGSKYYIDSNSQPTLNSSLTSPTLGIAISTTKILVQ